MGPFEPPWKPQVLFPVVVVVVHSEIALRAFDDNNFNSRSFQLSTFLFFSSTNRRLYSIFSLT